MPGGVTKRTGLAVALSCVAMAGCVSATPVEPCPPDTRQGSHGRRGVLGFRLEMTRAQAEARCDELRGEWDGGWCELVAHGKRVRIRADLERDPPLSVRPARYGSAAPTRARLEEELRAALGEPWPSSSAERTLYPLSRPASQPDPAQEMACTRTREAPAIAVRSVEGGGFDVSWSRVSWSEPGSPEECWDPVDDWDLTEEAGEPGPIDLRFGTQLGYQHSGEALAGPAFGLSAQVSLPATEWLDVGARAAWVTGGDAGEDLDGDGEDDRDRTNPHSIATTAELSATLWSEDGVDGGDHGWRVGVGGGYQVGFVELASSGPVVSAHLARVITHPSLVSVALVARYDRTFTEGEDHQLVTLGAEMGSPFDEEESRGEGSPAFPYLFGAHLTLLGFNAGADAPGFVPPGVGVTFGLPLGALLDLRARTDALALPGDGDDGVIAYSAVGGFRLRLDDAWPVFAEALGGWALTFGTEPRDIGDGPIVDVGVGLHALDLGGVGRYAGTPDLGLELALRFRAGLDAQDEPLRAILLATGLEWGSRAGALGGEVERRRLCF